VRIVGLASSVIILMTLETGAHALDVDPQLPAYKPVPAGAAQIEVDSQGSSTAPQALLDAVSQIGPMSRPMRSEEYEPFEKKYGYHPTSIPVAVDALAVFVNKDNPIQCLTIEQLDQIFSKTHLYSGGKNITTWGDAGLSGNWAKRPISLFGRNSASGTHDTFMDAILAHGEFKDDLKERSGSADVVKMVAEDKYAIGYSGIGYLTDGVRTVPLAATPGDKCYDTSPASTYAGNYPLSRYLYIYLNKPPTTPLDPPMLEFVKYILSRDGQTQTVKSGFYPITSATRTTALPKLGIPNDSN
jgi:phosphate transport system substrate-binding protein